ncbi:24727_t:CDS:2 [Gigaspora margarita]|uniref:24727_t:CDS:1 n=1 Tax=Gigaspora margarita TaxID=4874 RepID=A0ABN7UBD5_GIGMA|nr:24727_t:CDS:2 [Gigaspora margarita]
MSSKKCKDKTTLNNEQRKEVIAHKEKNPSISHIDLASWVKKKFGLEIHQSTIGHLLRSKDDIGNNLSAKRQRTYESRKENKMDVLTAIKYIVRAWREVIPNTVYNCFRHTKILPVIQNDEELITDNKKLVTDNNEEFVVDDNNELIEELHIDIEALRLQNVIDLDNYINYLGENDTNEVLDDQEIVDLVTSVESEINNSDYEENDDSIKIRKITHQEALNTIELLEQYFF